MTSTNEIAIKEALAQQKPEAYEMLFRGYFKALTVFANKVVQDLDLSQDLVQEVFIKLYEKKDELHLRGSLKSFLFQSVRNRCIDHVRSQKAKQSHHEHLINVSDSSYTNDLVEQTEFEMHVYDSIKSLPEQCQLIFKMNRFDGKKNQEIADELNISKRTVETQISKALKKLRVDVYQYMKTLILISITFLERIL